jgi:comEA protein
MWQVAAQPFTSRSRTFPRGRRAASARCGLETTHDAHCDGGSVDPRLGIAAQAGQEGPRRTTPAAKASASGPLNLNSATVAQLESLPGIGKSTAERILEYREKSGGFKKVEDLMNVRGIGEKSFLKLKPLVTVSSGKSGSAEQ